MLPLSSYRNRHCGSRCVLVANGPSLNAMGSLSFLQNEIVIGLNKIYLGFNKFLFYPKYYVAVNLKVINQGHDEIRRLNCLRFIDSRALESGLLPQAPLTCFLNEQCDTPFSTDLSLGYHQGCTVTHTALQVAYHLGFQTVILIGLDHRYEYQGKPGEERTLDGPDPNHFCENYFGHGQKWDNPQLAGSEFYYAEARKAYEADGRKILDATLGGACPVFEKQDYKAVFGLK
jgi:hypothetical protein